MLETARLGEGVKRLCVGVSKDTAGSQKRVESDKVSESVREEMRRWQLAAVGGRSSGSTVLHAAVRVTAAHLCAGLRVLAGVGTVELPSLCWFALSAETGHVDRQNC